MTNPLKPIFDGLEAKLGMFERQAQSRRTLLAKVCAALPAPENAHVVSAAYEKDCLVIAADSAAWSARLRYYQDELSKALVAAGETPFTKLRVKVGRADSAKD